MQFVSFNFCTNVYPKYTHMQTLSYLNKDIAMVTKTLTNNISRTLKHLTLFINMYCN